MAVEAERYNSAEFTPPWVRHEHMARYRFAATFVEGRTVVDCACGTGEGTAMFARANARHVSAFDVSADAVSRALRNCEGLGNVSVQTADALALPVPDSSADVFISLETFEHLSDQTAFLKEVRRILAPGGVFVCSTPNRGVYNPGRTLEDRPWNRFHVREFDTAEFRSLQASVFKDVRMLGQNPIPIWRAAAMEKLAVLPGHSAVRINQAFKLPRFLVGNSRHHAVMPERDGYVFEYDVAVCRL